ncbi:peptidoglycan D,D-transpeptidase FtsI family protein [Hymenobacter profundi]|uniref:beta-lactamase n=1 Tax=Hymenobacter profundi TaxID=1982110 RepID=A0ABS6WU15_9BACT|nr:penicillin-binding transpeptidase domain-containing protein [Hymenobacter profundi]MBW3126944.1 peptidoglycan glycosyltransferase [Hymenobacter profundi]MBW3127065.1 peptidoglycan glycosyltransferase [Hymenobacter profundi]
MRTVFTIQGLLFFLLFVGLTACSSSDQQTSDPAQAANPTYTRQRIVVSDSLHRGRILDRYDSVLVDTRPQFLLKLPRRLLDTLALGQLLGWDSVTVRQRLADALPYGLTSTGYPIQLRLTAKEAARVRRDSSATKLQKLVLTQRRQRVYTTSAGASVLGYLGAEAQAFYRQAKRAKRGRFYRLRNGGVETYYNGLLTGHWGYLHPLVDKQGNQHGTWAKDTVFQQGQDLHLTIDAKLQAYAEKLLGGRKGYLVALDPRTGEILAYVSAPVYPASTITAPDQAGVRTQLLQDADMPLLNRPAMLANPPGSVFKLVNAAAALQLGAILPTTGFRCDQSLVRCVHHHPQANSLTMGLKYSCNPYFYQAMQQLINRVPDSLAQDSAAARHVNLALWRRYVRSFGLDSVLGADVAREAPGFLPTPAYYDKSRGTQKWTYRSIYSLSIGQGEINLTGLQMANMVAIVANRGWYYPPHLVRSVGNSGPLPRFREKHHTLIDSANFAALLPGMVAVLQRGGTAEASSLADVGITVAGKTGTVQNDEGDDHAAFVGFAPADNPKIAVAVYLENAGFGATAAAPCAVLVMEKYLRGSIAPKRKRWERRMQSRAERASVLKVQPRKPVLVDSVSH